MTCPLYSAVTPSDYILFRYLKKRLLGRRFSGRCFVTDGRTRSQLQLGQNIITPSTVEQEHRTKRYIELEALGQCTPPPRHVLPVRDTDPDMDTDPDTNPDPDRHQNLIICSLAHC